MATVMSWGNSEGTKGRCDAKCHNAASSHCMCMCGGRYHGKGLEPGGVEETMREYGEEITEAANARAQAEGLEIRFHDIQQVLEAVAKGPLWKAVHGAAGGAR